MANEKTFIKKRTGYPFSSANTVKKETKQIIKEDLEDKTKRSSLIRCEECPKRCHTYKFVTNKEKAEILADLIKLLRTNKVNSPAFILCR